jgi:hypothetical protein
MRTSSGQRPSKTIGGRVERSSKRAKERTAYSIGDRFEPNACHLAREIAFNDFSNGKMIMKDISFQPCQRNL